MFTCSPVDLELNRDFNGEDYEYEDEAKLVIFPDHFEIPLPNIEELPALVRESLLRRLSVCPCMWIGCVLSGSPSPSFSAHLTISQQIFHSWSFQGTTGCSYFIGGRVNFVCLQEAQQWLFSFQNSLSRLQWITPWHVSHYVLHVFFIWCCDVSDVFAWCVSIMQ